VRERVQSALPSLQSAARFLRFGSSSAENSAVSDGSPHAPGNKVDINRRTSPRLMSTGLKLSTSHTDTGSGIFPSGSTNEIGSSRYPLRNRLAISDTKHAIVNSTHSAGLRQDDEVESSTQDQGRLTSADTLLRQGSSRRAAETAKQKLKDSAPLWSGRYKQDKY
jgi:hypothetical protein